MGINLGDIVPKEEASLNDFEGRKIAIDGQNTLYQFLSIIRQPDGTPLMDHNGHVTSHLTGLFYRTINLIEAGIKPVFVFDVIERDSEENILYHYVIIDLLAEYVSGDPIAKDDAVEAQWISRNEISKLDLNNKTRTLLKEKFNFA